MSKYVRNNEFDIHKIEENMSKEDVDVNVSEEGIEDVEESYECE